jgi:hypothetical protein
MLPGTPVLTGLGLLVVPVIQRWCIAPAVLPSQHLVDLLAAYGTWAVATREPRGVVFLLDADRRGRGWQLAERDRAPRRSFDNRYRYSPDRFPSAATLRRQGITTVRWVARDGVAEDLQPYVQGLADAGLPPLELGSPLLKRG